MAPRDPWEVRFEWIQTILQWAAFAAGAALSFVELGWEAATLTAAFGVGAYTLAMQIVPKRHRRHVMTASLLAVLGVVTGLLAIGLTGAIGSAYVVYLVVPIFFASAFHGIRMGATIAFLSIAGLGAIIVSTGDELLDPAFFQATLLYALTAISFSQARRILVEERQRTRELEQASLANARQLERLETAHSLLASLADLADAAHLNSVSVGRAALRDLAVAVPFAAGTVSITDEQGEIIVATRGTPEPAGGDTTYPIAIGERRLGSMKLWPRARSDLTSYADTVENTLRPVALAFDNIALLRSIAHRAVREERVRVARELHDDVGPSLVSVGLALDVVLVDRELDDDLRRHLESVRETVTRLVDEVRSTVLHLRAAESTSLVEQAQALVAEVGADGPAIVIDLDERRPPRGDRAFELGAILSEAVRNAVEHSGAKMIRITGAIDRDRGSLEVADDGRGFDNEELGRGHYGLTGMRERAAAVDAKLNIVSEPGAGTAVLVEWGTQ